MKQILKLLFVCIFFISIAQAGYAEKNEQPINEESSTILIKNPTTFKVNSLKETDVNLKVVNIQLDLLGAIFFGPQLSLDFQFANMISVGPYIRWNYAGMLYQGFITDFWSDNKSVDVNSFGVGGSIKFIPPIGSSGRHRPYIDLGYERFHGSESWDPGGTWGRHIYEYKANVFHFGAGYRMITDGAFNLSVGFFMGISVETDNIDYYEFGDEPTDYNTVGDVQVFPGVQLVLGWQLGGN